MKSPLALVLLLLCLLRPLPARARPLRWLQEHIQLDAAAAVGWRAALQQDRDHSGFQAVFGGGEVDLGLEFDNRYAVIAGARVLSGASSPLDVGGATQPYLESSGQLGAQLRLTESVRVALGASVGRAIRCCSPAVSTPAPFDPGLLSLFAGGFLRVGVDFYPREAALLRALCLWLRVDVDGHPVDQTHSLPHISAALSLSAGLRL